MTTRQDRSFGIQPDAAQLPVPERFRAKWTPVRVKKARQNKKLELRF
jgi:hypothetical protein